MKKVNGASVWTGNDLGGKQAICFDLQARHLEALDADMRAARRRDLQTEVIARRDFPLHTIAGELAALSTELQHGRGLLLLRGFPVDEYSLADLEVMYWGLGTHLGVAVSQSVMGDRLGHVIDVSDTDTHSRAYKSRQELSLHTDLSDVVSFLCVRKAKLGGLSWFASALAIHNEMLATRPDLLMVLYRGFHWHRYGEEAPGAAPVTPWRVPVFSSCEGQVSCRFVRDYIIEAAAHESVETLTDVEMEAIDYFEEIAHRAGMPIKFMLEPGEAVFINNFTSLHAREAFENHQQEEKKRLLLRLWMTVRGGRPVAPAIQIYDGGRDGGVPAQPGKVASYARTTEAEKLR